MTTVNESFTHEAQTGALTADQPWTLLAGTGWGITGNRAVLNASDSAHHVARCDTPVSTPDMEVSIVVPDWTVSGASNLQLGVIARLTSAATLTYYHLYEGHGSWGDILFLAKWVAGFYTSLAEASQAIVSGDVLKLRCVTVGGNAVLTASVNGTIVSGLSTTDSSSPILTGTYGGMQSLREAGTLAADAFTLADVAAGGDPSLLLTLLRQPQDSRSG